MTSNGVEGVRSSALLLGTWARRDFRIRYSQTLLGGAWAVAQPAGVTLAFVFLLSRVGASREPGVPYASFVFPGMLCWLLFANGVTGASLSVASSMPIMAKAKFPRIVAPISGALLPIVDFALASLFLPVLLVVQSTGRTPNVPAIALSVLGALTIGVGVGCLVGALGVFVRDLRNALPFAMQLLLLASPVVYPASRLPEVLQWNPMVTFVSLFRSSLITVPGPSGTEIIRACLISLIVLFLGVSYFRSVEGRFADVA